LAELPLNCRTVTDSRSFATVVAINEKGPALKKPAQRRQLTLQRNLACDACFDWFLMFVRIMFSWFDILGSVKGSVMSFKRLRQMS
jgi:hypothetical protein